MALMETELLRDIITTPILDTEPVKEDKKCPKCSAEIIQVNAGIFLIDKCTSCEWRRRQ